MDRARHPQRLSVGAQRMSGVVLGGQACLLRDAVTRCQMVEPTTYPGCTTREYAEQVARVKKNEIHFLSTKVHDDAVPRRLG